jgi:diguanylate cyclase
MVEVSIDAGNFEHATSVAGRALQLMAQHNVPATPHNFEIWFAFALGVSPELNKTIDILISNKRTFDAATNRSLFLTYVGGQADWDVTSAETCEPIRALLSSARGFAARPAENADPHPIIESLAGELSKAVTRATALEARFNASLQELDRIRNNLAAAEQRSMTDALTGLANRLALEKFLRESQVAAMESGEPLSIFLIDVDHFKNFNDQFGHQFGDQVLRLISRVVKDGVRSHDLAARYGGEELLGILPGADLKACAAVADRIRQTIADRKVTRRATGEVLSGVTVSVGVAQFVAGETLADLFARCDRALYAAKRTGRNRCVTENELDGETSAA